MADGARRPDVANALATVDTYAAGFDERGVTSAPRDTRLRACAILAQMRRQTRQ